MNKITLFLMTEKGFIALQAVLQHFSPEIIDELIIGRDKKLSSDYSDELAELAEEHGIKYHFKGDNLTLKSTYSIAISWRWMIPLNDGKTLITLHDSPLPKYRGFAPLVNQLINGETEIGVTAINANEGFDRGNILSQQTVSINYPIKIQEAIKKVSELYSTVILDVINKIQSGDNLVGSIQDEKQATYSLWRDEEDFKIDWTKSAKEIKRFIDSVGSPYKGALTSVSGNPLRVLEAEEHEDIVLMNRDCGKVMFVEKGMPIVVCGSGLLKLTHVLSDITGKPFLPIKKFRSRFL